MPSFSDRLKELRLSKQLTQKQMAEIFTMTERNYQRIEATNSPSNENLVKFADFFNVPTDYLLGRDNFITDVEGSIKVKVPTDKNSTTNIP